VIGIPLQVDVSEGPRQSSRNLSFLQYIKQTVTKNQSK